MHDVNVSYFGQWHYLVSKLQPALVDAGFRGRSEERILLGEDLIGQSHTGPQGHKQVVRHVEARARGRITVWFNDQEAHEADSVHAAALVADAYGLFLFGPMLIQKLLQMGRPLVMDVAGIAEIANAHHRYSCDVLRISMRPGLGLSDGDQLALYFDRDTHLMRRVRFSLEGLDSTRGALVEVDTWDHVWLHGMYWPTRFHEQLLRPAPLKVHDWRLTGLDVDRGYDADAITGRTFTGAALRPADALTPQASSAATTVLHPELTGS